VMYETEVEKNPALADEAAELLRKWEAGDKETRDLWEKMNNWIYEGWKKTYEDENVHFDIWEYESKNIYSGKEIVQIALDKGLAEKDETGAVIARLERYGIPDKVLLRSDGTSVYSTKDLQLAKDGYEKYKFDQRLYVVDYRQSDYFKQVFKILEILGFDWAKRLHHVSYGTVELPEGKMSSRAGLVVKADDVFDKLVELEKEEIKNSVKDIKDLEESAKTVALAAFRYALLKVDPSQDIVFRYDIVSKFEGNTGPYILYTYARARSVLEKAGFDTKNVPQSQIIKYQHNDKEESILRALYRFPEVVAEASHKYMPSIIANYIYDLAQRFNSFYAEVPIINSESTDQRVFRLLLSHGTAQILKNGAGLLGIDVVEKM